MADEPAPPPAPPATTSTLKQVANNACKRLHIGTAVMPGPLQNEPAYAATLEAEFNAVVIEHHLKWAPLCTAEPGPLLHETPSDRLGRYDFHHVDTIVDWCLERNIIVKGHVLVWHVTSPVALLEQMSSDQVRKHVKRHIQTTMGHFRGRIKLWDVVNEALAPDGSLAETVFTKKLGTNFIADCFRWAQEADPTAQLLYNDNKVETYGSPKAEAFFQLVKGLVEEGVPIHGVGMQAHFNAAGTGPSRPPTPSQLRKQIRRLGNLGVSVNLSEIDVRTIRLPESSRTKGQCAIYQDLMAAALAEPACDGIWLWGFTDQHSWVHGFYENDAPLIFDDDYQRKPSYYAFHRALESLTPGNTVGGPNYTEHDEEWGKEWMLPEPVVDAAIVSHGGDARPDWEQS